MDENSQMPDFDISGMDLDFLLGEESEDLPSVSQLLSTQVLITQIDKIPEG